MKLCKTGPAVRRGDFHLGRNPCVVYNKGTRQSDKCNICGDVELNSLELVQMIAGIMGKKQSISSFLANLPDPVMIDIAL